ncbi:MAG TPA: Ig-like domain-containing protein, partial [Tepidisphaeraceae bacterium]|nr:Ig-like domain-containing protein [Tepidisphaeraceae bacterium]
LTTSSLAVGSHSVTGVYSGDVDFNGSTSPVATQTVNQAAVTVTTVASPEPRVYGQMATLTATVDALAPGAGMPTGSVSFYDGITLLDIAPLNGSGVAVATFTSSSLAVGSHSITSVYNGDTHFTGATSPIYVTTVNPDPTAVIVTAAPDPTVFGQPEILSATVTALAPGAGFPTGTVNFFDGATLLGTATLNGSDVATFSSALPAGTHSITGVYAGDTSFTASTSPVDTTTVNADNTAIAVTAAPDPTVFGQVATFTATVSPVAPGAGVPTGSVSFFDGATLLGTSALNGSDVATFSAALAVGSHSITTVYTGDLDFNGSTSPIATTTVAQASSAVALVAAPDPSVFGQPAVFTATVTAVAPGAGTPSGSVDFFDGATLLGSGTLNGAGVATFTATLDVGSHALNSVYNGDTNFNASTSPVTTSTVNQAATSVSVNAAPDPSVFGQLATFTATVAPVAPGAGVATGTVNFFDGATLIGTDTLDGSGNATVSAALSVGSHSVTAVYGGDSSFYGSASPIDTTTVAQASTTVALTGLPDPTVFGQVKTLSAAVTVTAPGAGTPTGDVSFFDGATLLGIATVDGSGNATLIMTGLATGAHDITSVYTGDANFTASTSAVYTANVNQAMTTAIVTAAPDPTVFGQAEILSATVTANAPGAGTPTGTVTFYDGLDALGTVTLDGSGVATFSSTLTAGSHTITGSYNGDPNFLTSVSPLAITTVNQAGTTVALTGAPDPTVFGQSATFTATVTAVAPGAGVPTGTVSFFDGATLIGAQTLDGSGVATFSSALDVGSNAVTSVYNGDANFSTSTSLADTTTVSQANSTVAVSASADPSTFGDMVTVSAAVAPVAPGAGVPTGTVSFFDGATLLGTSTLDGSSVATLASLQLSPGSHSITGVYNGDSDFDASTSPADTTTVAKADTGVIVTATPSVFGQSTTLSATVSTSNVNAADLEGQTGTVSFFNGATLLGTATLDNSGDATFSTTLPVGSHSITGVFSGDANYNGSTSSVTTDTVTKASTSVVTTGTGSSAFGQSATLTSIVTATAPGVGVPTGTVSFFDGATLLGTGALNGSGVAALAISTLPVGSHSITSVYGGNGNFNGATSPASAKTVVQANSSVTTTATPSSTVFGQSTVLSAIVIAVAPGAGTPTGTVSFYDGATLLGTATLNGSDIASLAVSSLSAGSHSITSVYAGNANFNGSTSSALTKVVSGADTAVTEVTASSVTIFGQPATFTATVSVTGPGAGVPTGAVSFYDGSTLLGTGTINGSGVATFTSTTLSDGSHSVTSVYDGDSSFNGSTSAAVMQTVNAAEAITSVNHATFTAGAVASFTITTTGGLTPLITLSGALPTGLSFQDNGDGTATLTGTPAGATGGVYHVSLNATNGVTSDSQTLTLTINQAPAVTVNTGATFAVGAANTVTFHTSGFPAPTLHVTGTLPTGVTFTDNGNGTATLAGVPAASTGAVYNLTIVASNGVSPDASQSFALTVADGPSVQNNAFTVTPAPATPGTKKQGSSVQISLTQPISAAPPMSAFTIYQGDNGKTSKKVKSNAKQITGVTYDPTTQAISVQTTKALQANKFYVLTADASAIMGTNGIPLDGTGNGDVGSALQLRFGMGRRLSYVDAAGNSVVLKLSGSGTMLLVRQPDGQGDTLIISGSASDTVITGAVRSHGHKAQTTLTSITGLGSGSNQLPSDQFSVALVSSAHG